MEECYKLGKDTLYHTVGGTLTAHGKTVSLTAQRNRFLRYLVQNAGQTLTKDQIITVVWGYDAQSNSDALIYDTVSDVRRLLREIDTDVRITTKPGIGYVLVGAVQKSDPLSPPESDMSAVLPPAFAFISPKLTLDTLYLLLMGDAAYKKAWLTKNIAAQNLPALCFAPAALMPLSEDDFFCAVLPDTVWRRITDDLPGDADRMALYAGEASAALLSALRRDFQSDDGWRSRALVQNCRMLLETHLMPSVTQATLSAVLQNTPELRALYALWQTCLCENELCSALALTVLYALLGAPNFSMLAETADLPRLLGPHF